MRELEQKDLEIAKLFQQQDELRSKRKRIHRQQLKKVRTKKKKLHLINIKRGKKLKVTLDVVLVINVVN